MDNVQNYSQTQVSGMGQAELESRALIRTAAALNAIKENWGQRQNELDESLEKNRKLWAVFAAAMHEEDCPLPPELKTNILNLSMFVFQRTLDIQEAPDPRKLEVLININMNIAKGLVGNIEDK